MKNYSRSRSTSIRALLALVLFTAAGSVALKAASLGPEAINTASRRTLTFADRVAYQRAVEEVYWLHRIWPKENPGPKPSLDEVMPQQQIQQRVEEYLRNSQLLTAQWQRLITPEQLQAEINRMATQTRQPEVLRELFAALGNDPFIVAECLARPILSERLVSELRVASNPLAQTQSAGSLGASTEFLVNTDQSRRDYYLPEIASSAVEDPAGGCVQDTWNATATTGAPDGRYEHTAVWTGSEMIVWGGLGEGGIVLNSGGRYNPSTDSWVATNMNGAPTGRSSHSAVWTGSEMIVWGGIGQCPPPCGYFATGGRYNPSTDSWIATTTNGAPSGRSIHTAVWTGTEMIVWGGHVDFQVLDTGSRYNPSTNSWVPTTTNGAPDKRRSHTAVWTGAEMIVWGGVGNRGLLGTGGRYNPSTDSWVATSTTNVPPKRQFYSAVWTGSEMIIWGGQSSADLRNGGRYNPSTDSWVRIRPNGAPAGRYNHTAVWNGSEMIVWGGQSGVDYLTSGGRYNPTTGRWVATSITDAPEGRGGHTAVWTGSEMLVWGGDACTNICPLNTGGRYVPCTNN